MATWQASSRFDSTGRSRREVKVGIITGSSVLDYDAKDVEKPLLAVITGLDKPFRTVFTAVDYATVRDLREEYLARNPRSTA
jgi:hypothetical protein